MNHISKLPRFDEPQLAKAVEELGNEQLDELPFGAIRLNELGVVQVFNHTERAQSGYGKRPTVGQDFFVGIAPCMDNPQFRGRVDQALRNGTLDIELSHIGDFSNQNRELTVRIQSAAGGGYWIFIQRED